MSVQSFSAVCNEQTHTLILGSMPGVPSLDAVQYYAHKRNAFWPIMLTLSASVEVKRHANAPEPSYSITAKTPYEQRLKRLNSDGFGLWDVIAECERPGSLDSAIVADSVVVNDFVGLLQQFPRIEKIAFNGKAAQKLFERRVNPLLKQQGLETRIKQWISLPSSSPAMASLSLQQKYERWFNLLMD